MSELKKGGVVGRLTILEDKSSGTRKILCLCLCGTIKYVDYYGLKEGSTVSCGCRMREASRENGKKNLRHGHAKSVNKNASTEYKSWSAMIARCTNPKHIAYDRYKNKQIDKSWFMFSNFLADMGLAPFVGATLDRIDNTEGYNKDNCQWLSRSDNSLKYHYIDKGETR